MKKGILKIVILLVILVSSIALIFKFAIKNENRSDEIYTIITDTKFITMQNDGGSHYDIYYEFDPKTEEITKLADSYVGFKGYEYQRKKLYSKTLTDNLKKQLMSVLNDIIAQEDHSSEKNYSPYSITTPVGKEIIIYDKPSIDSLKNILKKIDDL